MKRRVMYMHTIDGYPAKYLERNRQITFAGKRGIRLVPSLAQIRREQRATVEWRTAQGYGDHDTKYGYVLVEVAP